MNSNSAPTLISSFIFQSDASDTNWINPKRFPCRWRNFNQFSMLQPCKLHTNQKKVSNSNYRLLSPPINCTPRSKGLLPPSTNKSPSTSRKKKTMRPGISHARELLYLVCRKDGCTSVFVGVGWRSGNGRFRWRVVAADLLVNLSACVPSNVPVATQSGNSISKLTGEPASL